MSHTRRCGGGRATTAFLSAAAVALGVPADAGAAAADRADELAAALRAMDARVVPADSELGRRLPRMTADDVRARLREAGRRQTEAWRRLDSQADWERFRDARIAALRESLGRPAEPPADLRLRVTGSAETEGVVVENLVFESRPGLIVTANLYRPAAAPAKPAPGLVVVHSHHNPKTQSELQDMGILWARAGCTVVVPDMPGHGERRAHPFADAASFPGPFRVGRQDYWFRYNTGMQLHLVGESLIGWMAHDISRCADVLLSRPGVDRGRLVLLGSVAGGGDPAAVAAALDARFAAVVPFNFGGPQPETAYPLPADAEETFDYVGGGSWESTRNLRLSARDGFLPWVIVGAAAPPRLVYAHEFS